MGSKLNKTIKTLAKSMKGASASKTTPYDTTAKVVRVSGDTVWVHIPGGVAETPVKQTISAKKGDSVQIRVANGTAWIVGNYTDPPSGASSTVEQILTGGEVVIPPSIESITNQYCYASIESLSELDEDEDFEDYMETEWLDRLPTYYDADYEPDPEDEEDEPDLYVWYRTLTRMSDGEVIYSDPMPYPNAKDGLSIVSMRFQYCVCDESRIPDDYEFEDIQVTKWFSRIPTQEDLQDPEEDEDYEPEEDGFYSDDEDFASDIADVKEDGWNLDGLTNVIEFTVDGHSYSDYTVTESGTEDATVHVNASTFNPTDYVEIVYDYIYTFDYDDEEEEYYIWMRAVMLMSDGSTKYGTPAYLPGVKPGDTEISIKVIIAEEPEYCLASATVIPDDDDFEDIQETPWTTTVPTYQEGNYYWRRVKYYYSDGTVAYSPPFYDFAAQIAHEVAEAESSQDNHFWSDSSGAYVGHVEGNKNSGHVLRAVSEGLLLTKDGNTMASFTQSGMTLRGVVGGNWVDLASYTNGGISFNTSVPFTIGDPQGQYIKWDSTNNRIVICAQSIVYGSNNVDLATKLSDVESTANTANSTANSASSTASSADSTANLAYSKAVAAQSTANTVNNLIYMSGSGLYVVNSSDTSQKILINSSGMGVYYGGDSVAQFGASVRIGFNSSGSRNIRIGSSAISFYTGSTENFQITRLNTYNAATETSYYANYILSLNESLTISAGTDNYLSLSGKEILCSGNIYCKSATNNNVSTYNIGMGSKYRLGVYSSSRNKKTDITYNVEKEFDPHKLYLLPVATFRWKKEFQDEGSYDQDKKQIGLIAEDVHDVYYTGAIHDTNGSPIDWNYRTLLPAMLKLIQEQHEEIEQLKAKIN